MAKAPREQEDIYLSIRDQLTGRITGLSNFTTSSFNWVWTQAHAAEFRELEVDTTAAILEGLVNYAGGPIDESDLETLGIEDAVTVDEINERLEESNLDELVDVVSVTRDPGTKSSGTAAFTVDNDTVTVPSGTEISTQPDYDGDTFNYVTTSSATPSSGNTTVDAPIEAVGVGVEYNVGSGTITNLVDEPSGVQSVTNNSEVTGGEDRETNSELRQRAKEALVDRSDGGTTGGIETYVNDNVSNVTDVSVEQSFDGDSWHGDYAHSHVVVDGGDDDQTRIAIYESRPVGVRHFLVRPDIHNVDADITVTSDEGTVSSSETETSVENYLDGLGFGDELIYNKVVQRVLNSDVNIIEINSIDFTIGSESHYFSEELIDDFEDNDILIGNRHWGDWSGDTGSFSAQSGTALQGTYSGELSSANADNSVTTTRSSTTNRFSLEFVAQLDNQTSNASDEFTVELNSAGSVIARVNFQGDGNIQLEGASSSSLGSWTAGTSERVRLHVDYTSQDVTGAVVGQSQSSESFVGSPATLDTVKLRNNTTASGSTVNAYIDDVNLLEPIQELGLGNEMPSDGIQSVSDDDGNSYTEVTNFEEVDVGDDGNIDGIEWFVYNHDWPATTSKTRTIAYLQGIDEYSVDEAMHNEGITNVEDAGGTVYTEGIDYEETDTSNDSRDNGIEWLDAGSSPDDAEDFTVTYDAAVEASIEYDINDVDISITNLEKINAGIITVTVQ